MSGQPQHIPVLQNECIEHLGLGLGDLVVDGTLGAGGHAAALLDETAPDGILVGFDVDEEALARASRRLEDYEDRVRLVHDSFRNLFQKVEKLGLGKAQGILLDLGISSPQLDDPRRGFRFAAETADDTPLDMRLDPRLEVTAADLLNQSSLEELVRIFSNYGEVPGSKRLARQVVQAREKNVLRTSRDLLSIISDARIGGGRRHNPATLVFQALRIAVNDELGALEEGLEQALDSLAPGGRLAVITYHSLEDRLVKNFIRNEVKGCTCPSHIPVCVCGKKPRLKKVTRKPIQASEEEIHDNPRARSARLRVAERVEED